MDSPVVGSTMSSKLHLILVSFLFGPQLSDNGIFFSYSS